MSEPSESTTTTSEPSAITTSTAPEREWPESAPFYEGPAPEWPFTGLVQLWHNSYNDAGFRGWTLRYWSWDQPMESYPQVALPDLEIDCVGRVALVSHGKDGVEIGGAPGAASGTFWIDWGAEARPVDPSAALLEEVSSRLSNVPARTEGDWLHLDSESGTRSYAMRDPIRPDGVRWTVQARHDGVLFLVTVHPAHLLCLSGVSWLSLAETGDFVACGASSAATAFIAPQASPQGDLVLPDPAVTGTYLECGPLLDLQGLPFTPARKLVRW